jgi:hypothetical protein
MKLAYNILSNLTCKCGKPIKQNLVNKKNRSNLLCYKCHRLSTGKPTYHIPRRKRLDAGLPVH